MFSEKNFYTNIIAPLSIIRATDWFEARILELCSYESKREDVIKTLQPGLRLRVEQIFKPNDISDGGLLCGFADEEVERGFYRSILSQECRDSDYAYDHRLDIEWDVFESSFEVEKFFNIDYLDYRNTQHLKVAFEHYYFDRSFPLKIPKEALDEIKVIEDEEYTLGFIEFNEFLDKAFEITRKALGFYN